MLTKLYSFILLQFFISNIYSQEILLNSLQEKFFTNSIFYDSINKNSNLIRPNRAESYDTKLLDPSLLFLIKKSSIYRSKFLSFSLSNINFGIQHNESLNSYMYDGRYLSKKGLQSVSQFTFTSTFLNHISFSFTPAFGISNFMSFTPGYYFYNKDVRNVYNYFYRNRINDEYNNIKNFRNFTLGQSSLSLLFKKFSFGYNRSNLWLGPGEVNSILMTNNAPGIPRIEFRTFSPLNLPLFNLEFFFFNGILNEYIPEMQDSLLSPIYISSKRRDYNSFRLINSNLIVISPRFIEGLDFGINRMRYYALKNQNDLFTGISKLLFTDKLFKDGYGSSLDSTDQLLSLYSQYHSKQHGFKIYYEFSRNDHSVNFRDLLMEPEHSSAYIVGAQKLFRLHSSNKFKSLFFGIEYSNLSLPLTRILRASPSFYSHFQIKEGYTYLNKYIGSNIGGGSLSKDLYFRLKLNALLLELSYAQIEKNRDLYIQLSPYFNHSDKWIEQKFSIDLVKLSSKYDLCLSSNLIFTKNYFWLNNFSDAILFLENKKINVNSISPNIRFNLNIKLN